MLIRSPLIFAGNVEKYVFPAAAPILRQAVPDPLGPLGQEKKLYVAASAHNAPCLVPPLVGFFKKEVRGHADPYQLAAFYLVSAVPCLLQRVAEPGLCLVYVGPVFVPRPVEEVHIAVLAAIAALYAAVPWVPYIVHIHTSRRV